MMPNDETNRHCYSLSVSVSFCLSRSVFLFCVTLFIMIMIMIWLNHYVLLWGWCAFFRVVYKAHFLTFFSPTRSLGRSLALLAIHFVCLFPILSSCSYFSRLISSSVALVLFRNGNKQKKTANAEENISFFVFYSTEWLWLLLYYPVWSVGVCLKW